MSYLINFLFSNLIPIIIVVSVVLRIYGGLKSAADSRRKAASRPVREAEEWDEDETAGEEEEADIQPRFYPAESAPPRQTAPQPSPSLVPLPETETLAGHFAAPKPVLYPGGAVPAEPRQLAAGTAGDAPAALFFRRVGALHPMQQALVLSEILGPPPGLYPRSR
jgi:hypothetical protein